ncbi:L-serine ammonia-lyase [Salmonella enterica]|nr:L-serine ammonia-lyase [Salmonella enterica]EAN3844041.1 L-serine ammonia-lyase [Salmonella enterica]
MISLFDMFKVGIGPSSSHTVGPMKAGKQFVDDLVEKGLLDNVTRVAVDVYGSLSLTGKGHHTDIAIIMGLAGNEPATVDIDSIPGFIRDVETRGRLLLAQGRHEVDFPKDDGMRFHNGNLPLHENGMQIHAWHNDTVIYSKTYYSIGGGFIVDEAHFGQEATNEVTVPYPFKSAKEMLEYCNSTGLSISGMVMQNELALHSKKEIEEYFGHVWQTMQACIDRGMNTEGVLPGPLRVPRRASALRRMLVSSDKLSNDPMNVIDWVNMFALAVNEENAAGGRVVTAPTNGACGIVPAVLAYYDHFIESVSPDIYTRYFLAAGLAELLGASPEQVCVAAEIGMEHNLGLTCDPVAGQVQVPCIERNAIASVKAINAARMAMRRTSAPRVSLDKVIETMYETGKDMNAKYRETSRGGLAIKVQCD